MTISKKIFLKIWAACGLEPVAMRRKLCLSIEYFVACYMNIHTACLMNRHFVV